MWSGRGHLTGPRGAPLEQLIGHLAGGPGVHTGLFDCGHHRVVVAHQPGAAHPTDQSVYQGDSARPRLLDPPFGDYRVECGLGFTVGAVAAEHAAVGRPRKHHMQFRVDIVIGSDPGQPTDEPLDRPEQHPHFHFGAGSGVGEITGDPRRRERQQQGRGHRVLDLDLRTARIVDLLAADPVDQRVDVLVGRHIRGHDPERGAVPRVLAVELAVEAEPMVVEARGGDHHRGTAAEQPAGGRRRDGTLTGTGDHGDIRRPRGGLFGVERRLRDALVQSGEHRAGIVLGLLAPPVRLCRNGRTGTQETVHRLLGRADVIEQPQLGQILACGRPAVVDQDSLAGIEGGRDQTRPVRTQFSRDQIDQSVLGGLRRRGLIGQTELFEHHAGGRGQHAVATGDLFGELAQRRGVHGGAANAARARQRDRDTTPGRDGLHGGVDGRIDRGRVAHTRNQPAEIAAANADTLTGAERNLGGDMVCPAVAQLPDLLDPLGDRGGPLTGRTEDLAQVIADGIGEHRTKRLVGAGKSLDRGRERTHIGIGGTVDRTERQFGAEVDEQLIAPR